MHEFTSTIEAWKNSGSPAAIYKSDAILHMLLKMYKASENRNLRPNAKLFGIILDVLASSNLEDKSKHADRILGLMKAYKVKPNVVTVQNLVRCYHDRPKRTSEANNEIK